MNHFVLKQEIYFGKGVLEQLKNFQAEKVFIITDSFMEKSGGVERLLQYMPGCCAEVFSEVVPEPPVEIVIKGARKMAAFQPDLAIALGGGSSIDAAKAILETQRQMGSQKVVRMVAVPTTSGTGSEVTEYAVITDPSKGVKYPLRSPRLIPDVALLDPELTRTVPQKITADTGMDVITHALEAFVSTGASDFSDAFAEKALSLAFQYLFRAYENGEDLTAREKMHNASCLAGLAFNNAGLGLNHGIAHAVGGRFHFPHGRINAVLLPVVIEYNAGVENDSFNWEPTAAACRYAQAAKLLGLESLNVRSAVKNLVREIRSLNQRMGIPATLQEMGVDLQEFQKEKCAVAQAALEDTCTETNPRTASAEDILSILNRIAQ